MKKITPNQIVKLLFNFIFILKPLSLTAKRVILLFVFSFFGTTILAQNGNSTTPKVMELDVYLSSLKSIDQNKFNYIDNLVYGLQPSIYFYSNEIKSYGEKPNTLYTDVNSMKKADNADILKENIEIVNLKITKINEKIDLSYFSNYNNLKYIFIVSKLNLNDQNIINMIHNYDEKFIIYYKNLKEE